DGDGTLGAGAAGRAGAVTGSTALASSTTSTSPTGSGATAGSGPAAGFAAPPLRAASRISCTLGRFAIALVLASACSPARSRQASTKCHRNHLQGKCNASSLLAGTSTLSSCGDMVYFRHTQFRKEYGFSKVRKSPGSNSQFMEPAIQRMVEPHRRAAASAWKPAA